MCAVIAYFHPVLSSQREQKDACHLWRSFRVMLIAKNRKFCKICKLAEVWLALQRCVKNRKFRNDLTKNPEVSEKSQIL